jgi:hypothetical protein
MRKEKWEAKGGGFKIAFFPKEPGANTIDESLVLKET